MKETQPNTTEGEATNTIHEAFAGAQPEGRALNSKGHERMAAIGSFFKNGAERVLKGAGKVAGGAVRLLKWGARNVTEGVAGVLSIDDIAKRGAVKVKDAAIGVKDAAVTKTREALTSARDGLVDAYHTTKEKGALVLSKGREKVNAVSEKYISWKLEIAMRNLKNLEDRKALINARIAVHKQHVANLLGLTA